MTAATAADLAEAYRCALAELPADCRPEAVIDRELRGMARELEATVRGGLADRGIMATAGRRAT